jgi:hypothetical protein
MLHNTHVMIKNKTLYIIAGAAGEIGSTYLKQLLAGDNDCIAVVRNKKVSFESSHLRSIACNLDNEYEIQEKFTDVLMEEYSRIVYLHTIGVDKFDPRGYPHIKPMNTIDPDIYNTNVNSFKYLYRYCIKRIRTHNLGHDKKIDFKIAIIAGTSDKHTPFVIESFCEVKFILRQYIQSAVNLYPDWISGLSINVTSTITESALKVRPFADTTYWLTPEDVVNQSINDLIKNDTGYYEIDLMKKSPLFVNDYYENKVLLYDKWSKETGIK